MGNMREYETQRGTKYTATTNIKKGANQSAKLVDVTREYWACDVGHDDERSMVASRQTHQ